MTDNYKLCFFTYTTSSNTNMVPTLSCFAVVWFPIGLHYKDKTVVRQSYLYNGNPQFRIPGKIVFVLSGGHCSYPMKSFRTRHHELSKLRGFLVVFLITMKCFRLPATFLKCNIMASMGNFARFHHKAFYWSSFLITHWELGSVSDDFPIYGISIIKIRPS